MGRLSEGEVGLVAFCDSKTPITGFRFGRAVSRSGGPRFVYLFKSSDDLADSGSGFRGSGFSTGASFLGSASVASLSNSRASSSVLRCR